MKELVGRGGSQFLTLPSEEVGIGSQFRKSIPDFISKVKELTSSYSCQFLPLLKGNSSIGNQCRKWIPHFRSVKWWIQALKWGIEKNVLLKVSNISIYVIVLLGRIWIRKTQKHSLEKYSDLHPSLGNCSHSCDSELWILCSTNWAAQLYEECSKLGLEEQSIKFQI